MENNKGFTLIELLVVVAIIGILAAVGTVAYTGYTEGAKKSSAKSNHAAVVKYIAAEDQKCNVGGKKAFGANVDNDATADVAGETFNCEDRTGATIVTAAVAQMAGFKNPHSTDNSAVTSTGTATTADDKGYVRVIASGNTLTITTCFDATTKDSDDKPLWCAVAADRVENKIQVAE